MLGLKDVPVIRLGHLDEAERRAYRIADNKLTELGEWDEAMLRDEIAGLLAEDFDLTLLGIPDEDLDALLRDPDQDRHGSQRKDQRCQERLKHDHSGYEGKATESKWMLK
jgi:cytochrome P450